MNINNITLEDLLEDETETSIYEDMMLLKELIDSLNIQD